MVKRRNVVKLETMTTKELLLQQFTISYDENGWFVSLKNALNNLTAAQAAWKIENLDNSVWEILAHLNFYNERYLKRFKGESLPPSNLENNETFAGAENSSEKDWQAKVKRFETIMSEWRNLLESAAEDKFTQAVSAENPSTWQEVISNINTHNAHHGGQIVVIRKLQKSWDASKGVS